MITTGKCINQVGMSVLVLVDTAGLGKRYVQMYTQVSTTVGVENIG
jgi:hypothetical protein